MADSKPPQGIDPDVEILNNFNKAIGFTPPASAPEQGTPNLKSVDTALTIKGNPITGINPGLKNGGTKEYMNSIGNYLDQVANTAKTPNDYMKPYTYNGDYDGANFERYFGSRHFNELGFNPNRDNDALYNEKSTFGDDFTRAASQWPTLVKSGFMSGLRSWGDMFTDPLAPDLTTAREMQKAMAIGSSTKKGAGAFFNNTFLNSAYTIGIGGELLMEELGLAAVTAFTGGGAGAVSLPAMAARFGKASSMMSKGAKILDGAKDLGKGLDNMSDLRTFWQTTGKGLGNIGAALNPLENTWELGKDIARGTNSLKYTNAAGKINEFARVSDNFGRFAKDMLLIKSAVGESKLEGGMVQMDITKNLVDKYRAENNGAEPEGQEMVKIENIAKEEARRTALWNMPAIMFSNKLMYQTLFAPFERGIQNTAKDVVFGEIGKTGKKGFTALGDGVMENLSHFGKKLLTPKEYGKFGMGYLKANLAEGMQENIQEAISEGSKLNAEEIYTNPNRGVYEGYMGHFLTGMKHQASMQGLETFAGGFLMGAMAQPAMSVPTAIGSKAWDKTFGAKKYKEYRTERDAQVAKTVETLNELYQNPTKYFAPDMANLIKQDELAVNMYEAIQAGSKNGVKDIEHVAGFSHIHTALVTGHYDIFMNQLKELKKATPEDATGWFDAPVDTEVGTKAINKVDQLIQRAENIKKSFDEVNANYPNPYKANNFKEGTADYISQQLASIAWDKAQEHLIYARENFIEHGKRLREIAEAFTGKSRPLENASLQDLMILLNPTTIQNYASSLEAEVRNLDPTNKDDAAKIKKNNKQIELLRDLHNNIHHEQNIKDYYTKGPKKALTKVENDKIPTGSYITIKGGEIPYVVVSTNKNKKGRTLSYNVSVPGIKGAEEHIVSVKDVKYANPKKARGLHQDTADTYSRTAFSKYLRFLSESSGDFFFNEKVNKAYDLIKDHMLVKEEMGYLVDSINVLADPKGFLKLQQSIGKKYQEMFDNVKTDTENRIKEYVTRVDSNKGINQLMKETGLVLSEKDWYDFVKALKEGKEPLLPVMFIDVKTYEEITSGPRFEKGKEVWLGVLEMVKSGEVDKIKEETPQGIKPVVEVKPEEKKAKVETKPVKTDVESIQDLYNNDKLPDSVASKIGSDFMMMAVESNADLTDAQVDQYFIDNELELRKLIAKHNIKVEGSSPVNWDKLIADSISERELDKVMDQIDAVGGMTPALADAIAQKRSGFIPDTKIEVSQPDAQKRALAAVDAIKEETKNAVVNDDGYTINGELYNERVSSIAAEIAKNNFEFHGKKPMVAIYNRFKGETGYTPEALVEKFKADPKVREFFEKSKQSDGTYKTRFTPTKIELLLEGLKDVKTEDEFVKLINKLAYNESSDRGNSIDLIVRDFFETGADNYTEALKPKISEKAFDQLMIQMKEFKALLDSRGEVIVSNGLTLYGTFGEEERNIAGTMDLLVITPEGKFKIYDIKTADKWGDYNSSSKKRKAYGAQLSLYKNLLEHRTGLEVIGLEIVPVLTTTDDDGYIENVRDALIQVEPKELVHEYMPEVEKFVPKRVFVIKAKAAPKENLTKLQSFKNDMDDAVDLLSLETIYEKKGSEVRDLAIQEAEELDEADSDNAFTIIETIEASYTAKQDELLTDSTNIGNLVFVSKPAQQKEGWTVNFVTEGGSVGNNYSVLRVNRKTGILEVELGDEKFNIANTDVTRINRPGELLSTVYTATPEAKEVIESNKNAIQDITNNIEDNIDEITAMLKRDPDDLKKDADKACE